TEFSTLTTGTVNGIDILIISSTTSNTSHFTPLTTSEQNVLFDFAQGGGCAILLPDNSTFGGAGTPAANESLIDPFGLDIGGTLPGKVLATVPNPSVSTITNGPFGVVSSFSQNVPGGLTNLGSFASSLAVNPLGDALAVIEAGVLGPRSGRVVIYSDVNMFGDSDAAGFFSENQALFLNTIQFCGVRIATAVTIDIKPGSFPNSINLGSQGTIPVAIFSSPSFDATIIDPLTVTLANASVRLKGNGNPMASFEDVDGDGLLDVIVHIDTSTLMLTEADTEAVLEAQTVGGQRIVGRDSVRIVP
ncbi:MAG: hypothetical protein OEN50_15620, partial [Deltaproteobacteria bacterium]|nr:hypothetical protein [Deltaproteobacteria bacterium]